MNMVRRICRSFLLHRNQTTILILLRQSENIKWIGSKYMTIVVALKKIGISPVPRIFVIDKTGKLIYNSRGLKEKEDLHLSQLNDILKSLVL